MNKIRLILLFAIFSTCLPCFFSVAASAQQLIDYNTIENNHFHIGFDKILNTYIFRARGSYSHSSPLGSIFVKQNYVGTAITSISNDFRDDESFNFRYKYPIFEQFNIAVNSNYLLNSDTRSSGVNSLKRLNGSIGGEWNFFDLATLSFGYGADDHSQSGYRSKGNSAYGIGNISPFDVDGYQINSRGAYEMLSLDNNRRNLDFFINSQLLKEYSNEDNLSLMVNYKKQTRDFIQPFSSAMPTSMPIETRSENRFSSFLNLNFNPFDNIFSSLSFTFEDSKIERSFKNNIENNSYSFINRQTSEQNIGFNAEGSYITYFIKQNLGISFQQRTENNLVDNIFDLNELDFRRIMNQEKQRDNSSLITRLYTKSSLNLTDKDTIGANLFLSMNRYDTPSNDNFDDRDEFSSSIGLFYGKYFSPIFKANIQIELIQTHLVFLKSQRSAMNNWNRVLRLVPSFDYSYRGVSFKPRFEIIANYTVYDFEDETGNTRSFSFRQIGLSDSIKVFLTNNLFVQSRLFARYYERGILYWGNFSEIPQTSNLESFVNFLIYSAIYKNVIIGVGGRFYKLQQHNLTFSGLPKHQNYFEQFNYGPEVNINLHLLNNSNVSISGWFDFRQLNKRTLKPIGNLFVNTTLSF